jgi:hypothetical protein
MKDEGTLETWRADNEAGGRGMLRLEKKSK